MWLVVDLVLVGLFAVIGRLSHHGSLSPGGWWTTAWPFLAGTLLAWAVLLSARRPTGTVGAGVVVWIGAVIGGMALRQASAQGTAVAFVLVATLVLGALLVLPRAGFRLRAPARRQALTGRRGS